MKLARALIACAVLVATGCATTSKVSEDPAAVAAREARAASLKSITDWSLRGRAALSDGSDGGSGSVRWYQRGDATDLTFAAPLGRGGFRLDAQPGNARLDLDDGRSYRGTSIDDLLQEHTGWEVPVEALRYWVRGLAAPGGSDVVRQDEDGLPLELRQFGWIVSYRGFRTLPDGVPMPRRVEAVRKPYKVKLIVREWALNR